MKAVLFAVGCVIIIGSFIAGVADRKDQKKRECRAEAEGKEIHKPYGPYEKYFKRPLDFGLGCLAMTVFSPLFLALSLIGFVKMKGSPFFSQERPGRDTKIFRLFKYKSMLPPQTLEGKILTDEERLKCVKEGIPVLSDEERLTSYGRTIRCFSLDELPEIWNIVKGDMSMVGPRPLVSIYLPYYTKEENHRHDVRPGLTGLAQVHGRNSASWEKRFKLDTEYVRNITFLNDLKIIFETVLIVFKREDIGQGKEKPESFSSVRQKQMEKKEMTT